MTTGVVIPLLAAALGAIGGWLSSYALKRRDDRLLSSAVARRLELELEWAEAVMRMVLPAPSGERREPADSASQDPQAAQAVSNGEPIRDWGEQADWRITTWDDVDARNRLAMRLSDNDSWESASRCVMRLDNLQRWVALSRKDPKTYPWPRVHHVASVVDQVALTRADLIRTEDDTPRRRVVLSALAGGLVLAAIAVAAVWAATDEELSTGAVAQQLRDTVKGESVVNCSVRADADARWDCTVVYDGCGPAPSPTGTDCDETLVRSEEQWVLTADPDTRCTSARVRRLWRPGDTRPVNSTENTATPARLLGGGCTRD